MHAARVQPQPRLRALTCALILSGAACSGDPTAMQPMQPITAGGFGVGIAGTGAAGTSAGPVVASTAGVGAAGSSISVAGRSATAGTGFGSPGVAGSGASSAAGGGGGGGRGGIGGGQAGRGVAGSAGSAGSGAVAGTGGSTGSTDFKPCPATGECKILPLGDSITVSLGFAGSYRVHLFELAVMNMKKITFVGSLMNGPSMAAGMPFPTKYEAVSGITISGIDGHIPSPGLNDVPHIVLVHIGTNDMYMSPAAAPDRLGTLIDGIAAGAPNALIVVAQIIPLPSGAAAVKTFNDALPAVVKKRADAGKHVILADLFTGFPTSELVDGVHPGQPGCSRMAEKWYGAISSYLN